MTEAELQRRWQSHGASAPFLSVQYVKHRLRSLEKRARARNAIEYVAALVGTGVSIWAMFYFADALMGAALLLLLFGGFISTWRWHRDAKVGRGNQVTGVVDGLTAYRRELERQRDVRDNYWRRYLAPMIPGAVMIFVVLAVANPVRSWFIVVALSAGWIYFNVVINRRAASNLQKEIDALDTLRSD
jgi:Flp pilus assembly protein TadB